MDVGIIGCGIMGHGIAQVSAQAGYGVVLCGRSDASLERALALIGKGLGRLEAKGTLAEPAADVLARITPTRELSALADCGLVIETVDEDLAAKLALWRARRVRCWARTRCAPATRPRCRSSSRRWPAGGRTASSGCTSSTRRSGCRWSR